MKVALPEVKEGSTWYDPILRNRVKVHRITETEVFLGNSLRYGIPIEIFIKRYEFEK